jgi:ribosomal protein S18 acetylase RimI-like enzyme
MSAYQIREAQLQDLEGIYAVFSLVDTLHCQAHPEIFQKAANPDDIKDFLLAGIQAEESVVFVAEDAGEIIGAINAWIRLTPEIPVLVERTYVSVENLVVAERYRQQGIGQALMEQIHFWAQAHGLREIQLTVWDFNQGAVEFYEKLGYQMLHHRMRKVLS